MVALTAILAICALTLFSLGLWFNDERYGGLGAMVTIACLAALAVSAKRLDGGR
jgi:surface polysaccharide O-acyltransferase-like enzyme